MIGRQIPFLFLDGADATALCAAVTKLGGVIVSSRSPTRHAQQVAWPTQEWLLFLAQADRLEQLAPQLVEQQGYWVLGPSRDQVVEWSVHRERDGALRAGRLYYVPRDLDGEEWRERPADFLAFAQRVRRSAERLAPLTVVAGGRRARVGPSARRRHEAGDLRLVWS